MSDQDDKKVEETKEEVSEAIEKAEDAAEKAVETAEKVEEAAEKADAPKVEAAAEKAEDAAEAAEKAVEAVEKAVEKHEAAEEKAEKAVPGKFKEVVKAIEVMSVLELAELVKVLEEKFGVSAAPVAMAGGAPAGGGEAGGGEEKSSFTVVLKASGDKKIEVIKVVRELTQKGLSDSKAIVDGAPGNVLENVKKEVADEAKTKLEAAGATVELT